uniref:Glycosyltransferase RgtA/B/C/D-like domain-containing protein n=1 Tax=Desulfobacca acetoxidans TaxID=60893 RepID=A0A7C3Z441_9BACT
MSESASPPRISAGLPAKVSGGLYPGLLVLAGLGLFFFRLGTPGLMDPDEGRYAEIAREMLLLKDWLIPHLNLVPYLEKPPLVYWLTALSFATFGLTEGAARLPSALAALAGVFWAFGLGRALWGERQGFWGAMVLATCGGYVILARLLTLDMVFTFFLDWGIALGYLALSRERPRLWPWAYLALALAVLAKGPVALVLAGLIWGPVGFRRGRQAVWALVRPGSWLLLAAVVLPWFLYVAWRYPEFPRFFFWEHHVARYVSGVTYHAEPWWYFGPLLVALLLPWTALAPWGLGRQAGPVAGDRIFLLIWAGVILGFFSVSRGKLAPYILPALLPLALLVGEGLAAVQSEGRGLRLGVRVSLISGAALGWLLAGLYFRPPGGLAPLVRQAAFLEPYLPASLVLLALAPTATLVTRRLEVLLAGALLFAAVLPLGLERLALQRSPRELGVTLRDHWQPGAALVGIYLYSQGLSFYSGQVFHLLEFRTELNFGQRLAPDCGLFLKDMAELQKFCASRPLVFFYLKAGDLFWLKARVSRTYDIIARKNDCLLIASHRK